MLCVACCFPLTCFFGPRFKPKFSFGFYMKECLGQAICELITLDYFPWAIVLVPAVIGLVLSVIIDGSVATPEIKTFCFGKA